MSTVKPHAENMALFCEVYMAFGLDSAVDAVAGANQRANPRADLLRARVALIAEKLGTTYELIVSRSRARQISDLRSIAMWVLRQERLSFPTIARALGGMHHTSVLVGVRRVDDRPELLARARELLDEIEHRRAA